MYSISVGDSGDEFVTAKSFRDVNVTLNFTPLFAVIGDYLRSGSSGSSAGRLCRRGDRLSLSIWVGCRGCWRQRPRLFLDHCDRGEQ